MAGNKTLFTEAIRKAHNAAWDGNWKEAIAAYRRAIAEFPEDVTAHSSLAHALEENGQLEDAIHECRIASKFQPLDLEAKVRIASLQEKLGLTGEAAGTYLAVAESFAGQKLIGKAVEMWQRAAALEPDRTDVHQRLADVYQEGGHRALATKEYITQARILQKRGSQGQAVAMAQKALALDPHNAAVRALLDEIQPEHSAKHPLAPSPIDKAQQAALSRLAETLLDERPSWAKLGAIEENRSAQQGKGLDQFEIDSLIARAVDAQTQNRVPEAIESYRTLLESGVTRSEVKFNLGLLYFETMRYDEAVSMLNETMSDPNYSLASHYALGQCYHTSGKVDAAVEHFLQVTKIVDLASVRREQADELISVYEGLAESFVAKGDRAQAESFSRSLVEFLNGRGWEDKVRLVRQHLEALREEGGQVSLAEVIEVPESAQVLEALAFSQEYLRRGKLQAAAEECFRAIELAPSYLPAHVRLAEVLARCGQVEDARAKYQTLADLAMARSEAGRAEGYYRQLLKLVPDDMGNRSKLVDLLLKQGMESAALEEYLELGEGHNRAGQFDKAAEKLTEGIRLAARSGVTGPVVLKLRHCLADSRILAGNMKGALAAYQEIEQQYPQDERAQIRAVDLEFRLGQPNAAQRDLDELLSRYRAQGEIEKAITVLEDLVKNNPSETAPRARLAQCFIAADSQEKAIATLDALGELQMSAGQKQAAVATINQIISMNPPRIEEYRTLLRQIAE